MSRTITVDNGREFVGHLDWTDQLGIKVYFADPFNTISSVAHGTIQMDAFSDIIPAPDGVFLIPESGVSIYIPAATVEPTDAFRPLVDAWMAARSGG